MTRKIRRIMATVLAAGLVTACAGERPADLGVQNGELRPCPDSPNCVSSFAVDDRHRIAPLVFTDAPDRALARLKGTLERRGDVTIIEQSPTYLRVELRTRLFVDDGEFLLDAEKQLIHLRSASRLGWSDLGKNRDRMEAIRNEFARSATKETSDAGTQSQETGRTARPNASRTSD